MSGWTDDVLGNEVWLSLSPALNQMHFVADPDFLTLFTGTGFNSIR